MSSNPLLSSFQSPKVKNKFKCEICLKLFSTNGNLKNHINTIHNHIFPFKCPIQNCNKAYSNQSRLEVHYRTHIGIKPFICPICKKSFNEKGNLKTHISFHTNLRLYKCNYCNKSYKTQGHLKDHIEIQHLKLRKYTCQYCNNKFGRRSTLSAHLKIHYDEKGILCKYKGCNLKFLDKENMENHYKKHLENKNVFYCNVISKSNSSTSLNSENKKEDFNYSFFLNIEKKEDDIFWQFNDIKNLNEGKIIFLFFLDNLDNKFDSCDFTTNFNTINLNNDNYDLMNYNYSYYDDNKLTNIEMEKDNFPFFINDINVNKNTNKINKEESF